MSNFTTCKERNRKKILEERIKVSVLWPLFKLNKNVGCINQEFSDLLLKMGDGTIENFMNPESWNTDDVCLKIYRNMNKNIENSVILALHNEEIGQLNVKILKMMTSELHTYYSIDYATYEGVNKTDEFIFKIFNRNTE